jgi:predicted MFS family arabinose efflux permease
MNSEADSFRRWRVVALVGASLVAVGVGAYFTELSRFNFEFIDDYFDFISLIALVGGLGAFIGCIGWAKHLGRSGRASMGSVVFVVPWIFLLLGYLIDGLNVHGSAAAVLLLMISAAILAIVLWIMAATSRNETPTGVSSSSEK